MTLAADARYTSETLFLRYKEILLFNLVIIETKKILIDLITKLTIYLLRYITENIYFFNSFYLNNELSK